MSKGKYGEPWSVDETERSIKFKGSQPEAKLVARSVACVNALDGVPDEALENVRELMGAIGGPDQGIPWLRNIIAKISAVEPLLAPKVQS